MYVAWCGGEIIYGGCGINCRQCRICDEGGTVQVYMVRVYMCCGAYGVMQGWRIHKWGMLHAKRARQAGEMTS